MSLFTQGEFVDGVWVTRPRNLFVLEADAGPKSSMGDSTLEGLIRLNTSVQRWAEQLSLVRFVHLA